MYPPFVILYCCNVTARYDETTNNSKGTVLWTRKKYYFTREVKNVMYRNNNRKIATYMKVSEASGEHFPNITKEVCRLGTIE